VVLTGLPERTGSGVVLDEVVDGALFQTFESLPRPKRRDANVVSVAIEKAVRAAVGVVWNKRPAVHVLVIEV
jgi:ribonuclease J